MPQFFMVTVTDNFLNLYDYNKLWQVIDDRNFPWIKTPIVPEELSNKGSNNMQMVHYFYENCAPSSQAIDELLPLFQMINPLALIRVKANLTFPTKESIESGYHIDCIHHDEKSYLRAGILYMNTCNGYTKFEDGTVVDSVANRFVSFPNAMKHTGATCTDAPYRIVLNVNYIV